MNPDLIFAFQDELEKISSRDFLRSQLRESPEIKAPSSRDRKNPKQLTLGNLANEIEWRYSKRAPNWAQRSAALARESAAHASRRNDPNEIPVTVGSGKPGSSKYNRAENRIVLNDRFEVLPHEVGHAAQQYTDNVEYREADATRRAAQITRKAGVRRGSGEVLVDAALGTYHDPKAGPGSRYEQTRKAVQQAAQRDRYYHPYYRDRRTRKEKPRAEKSRELADRFKERRDKLRAEKLERIKAEKSVPSPDYAKIRAIRKEYGDRDAPLKRAFYRALGLNERTVGRLNKANPFVDKKLYESMRPDERAVLQKEIDRYAEVITENFGPERAQRYREAVSDALKNQKGNGYYGGSVRNFLRKINSKAFLRKIR